MRRLTLVLTVTIAAVAAAVTLMSPFLEAQAAQGPQFRQVTIRVTCDGTDVDEVNIRPWTVKANRSSNQIRWRLVGGSQVDSARIVEKSTSSWPFDSNSPLTVLLNAAVDSGTITDVGDFYYNIIVDCGSGDTVIDPRMDIDP